MSVGDIIEVNSREKMSVDGEIIKASGTMDE